MNFRDWGGLGKFKIHRVPGWKFWGPSRPQQRLLLPGSLSSAFKAFQPIGLGFPGGASGQESTCQCRQHRFDPWVRKIPWRREWSPTPVFLPGELHGKRSLEGYSPWGRKIVRQDWATNTSIFHFHVHIHRQWWGPPQTGNWEFLLKAFKYFVKLCMPNKAYGLNLTFWLQFAILVGPNFFLPQCLFP